MFKDTCRRAKVLAAASDTTLSGLIESIVSPRLDELERQGPARLRSAERPTRRPAS
jgi:hypothetical protein